MKAKHKAHCEMEVYIQSLFNSILDDVGSGSRSGCFTIEENVPGGQQIGS